MKDKERVEILRQLDTKPEQKLDGERRWVDYNDFCDVEGCHSISVIENYPEDAMRGNFINTRYLDGRCSTTDYGCQKDVPVHWNNKQVEDFLEMNLNVCSVSEVFYDRYLQSNIKDFDLFLTKNKLHSGSRSGEAFNKKSLAKNISQEDFQKLQKVRESLEI